MVYIVQYGWYVYTHETSTNNSMYLIYPADPAIACTLCLDLIHGIIWQCAPVIHFRSKSHTNTPPHHLAHLSTDELQVQE